MKILVLTHYNINIVPLGSNAFPALQYIIRYQVSIFGLCMCNISIHLL